MVGGRSYHMHAVTSLVRLAQTVRPDLLHLAHLENAVSVLPHHRLYLQQVWKAPEGALRALYAGDFAAAARKHFFLSPWPADPPDRAHRGIRDGSRTL